MSTEERKLGTKKLGIGLLFLAVVVAAINLRAGIASVGAVLPEVLSSYQAGGSLAGLITAMPGIFFAIMGLAAVPLAMRLGLSRTLVIGMIATLVGLALRPWVGSIAVFIVLTALVVMGIALANVLLPAWIKEHGGRKIVALMTVYSSVLGLSGALGPLSSLLFDSWHWALMIWAIPAALQLAVWGFVWLRVRTDIPSDTASTQGDQNTAASLWRSPTAVFLLLFFGLQSMSAYVQMGWLPQMLIDAGVHSGTASISLALVGGLNVAGGLVMPWIIDKSSHLGVFPVLFGVLTFIGYGGILLFGDHYPLFWSFLLGVGGFCFPTAIALIPARSRSPMVTARLSGFVQPYGYIIAALGPFIVGVVHEHTGGWVEVLWGLMIAALVMSVVGLRASKRGYIDDELALAAN